ncbi:hypothetical protein [Leifsonia kafniensis]|uniref:hypothetical protein n=1 Tax=Leifsonia kafniensis TaxID=475957 RepID=UPI0031ECBDDB
MSVVQKSAGIIVALGISGAVMLSGLPPAASEPTRPRPSSQTPSATAMNLPDTAESIARVGATQFPGSFGGVEYNEEGNGLIVHLVGSSPALESSLLQAASADPAMVTFSAVTRTYASLTELNDRVASRFGAMPAEGIDIRSSGIGPGPTEIIGVRGLTTAISDRLHREFGYDVVVVEAGPEGTDAIFTVYTTPRPSLWNLGLF